MKYPVLETRIQLINPNNVKEPALDRGQPANPYLIRRGGDVKYFADVASLGYVTRARITQIMNLLNLASDI